MGYTEPTQAKTKTLEAVGVLAIESGISYQMGVT
tara:strand:+ start:242 stop:343 length:102 start_codon:yes stop_codon:yes gene_type:complete